MKKRRLVNDLEIWQPDQNAGHAGWSGVPAADLPGCLHQPSGSLFVPDSSGPLTGYQVAQRRADEIR